MALGNSALGQGALGQGSFSATQALTPGLFTNTSVFYSLSVVGARIVLSLITNVNEFYHIGGVWAKRYKDSENWTRRT